MSKEIAAQSPDQDGPPTLSKVVAGLRRSLICWIPDDPAKQAMLVRDLTHDERKLVLGELSDLELRLAVRDRLAIERAVTAMMLVFPSGRAAGDEARVVIAAYVATLSDLPPWAVEETTRDWMRGRGAAANFAFQPSAAELHRVGAEKLMPFQRAAHEMRGLLKGITRQPSGEERERVGKGLRDLAGEIRGRMDEQRLKEAALAVEPGEGPYARAMREQPASEAAE